MKEWFREQNDLTVRGKRAKMLVNRICKLLEKISGRKFVAKVERWQHCYEGHIYDSGKCREMEDGELGLSDVGEEIGMIFWGGYHDVRKYGNLAMSMAWESLLEDCIGNAENGKFAEIHSLTENLKTFGPKIDLNCKTVPELEKILAGHGI